MSITLAALSVEYAKRLWESGEQVIFLDARNPEAWGKSSEKLPGALRIPADEVSQHLSDIPPKATVIAYCT